MTRKREQELTITPEIHDSTPIVLNADQSVASLQLVNESLGCLKDLAAAIEKNNLTTSLRYNTIHISQSCLKKANDILGGQNDDKNEVDRLVRDIRDANDEIRRLNARSGHEATIAGIGVKLDQLADIVNDWWRALGFGSGRGKYETSYGSGAKFVVEFNAYLDRHAADIFIEDKPVTAAKMKVTRIEELATKTDIVERNGDVHLLDTPRNRQFITEQIETRFPGSRLWEINSYSIGANVFVIRTIKANIPIEDIEQVETVEQPKPKKAKK